MFDFSFVPRNSVEEYLDFDPSFMGSINNSSVKYNFGLSTEPSLSSILFTSTYDDKEEYESSFSLSIQDALTLAMKIMNVCNKSIQLKNESQIKELVKEQIVYSLLNPDDTEVSELNVSFIESNDKRNKNSMEKFDFKLKIETSPITGKRADSLVLYLYSNSYQSLYSLINKKFSKIQKEVSDKNKGSSSKEIFKITSQLVIDETIKDFIELLRLQITRFLLPRTITLFDLVKTKEIKDSISQRININIDKSMLRSDIKFILNQVKKDTDNALKRMDDIINYKRDLYNNPKPMPIKSLKKEDMEKLSKDFLKELNKKGDINE